MPRIRLEQDRRRGRMRRLQGLRESAIKSVERSQCLVITCRIARSYRGRLFCAGAFPDKLGRRAVGEFIHFVSDHSSVALQRAEPFLQGNKDIR